MSRGWYEDATRKLLPWNLSFTSLPMTERRIVMYCLCVRTGCLLKSALSRREICTRLIQGYMAHTSLPLPKRHLDRFSRFYAAYHMFNTRWHKHPDHATFDTTRNGPHLHNARRGCSQTSCAIHWPQFTRYDNLYSPYNGSKREKEKKNN